MFNFDVSLKTLSLPNSSGRLDPLEPFDIAGFSYNSEHDEKCYFLISIGPAILNYELWKIETGELKREYGKAALEVYQKLYEKKPMFEYIKRMEELT